MLRCAAVVIFVTGLVGCGTTRWTDTTRTATEQMLVSDAIDRAVSRIDFKTMSGQSVFLDTSYLNLVTDKDYLISTLRQHMLASGCVMEPTKEKADFIIEARAGAVGTDRHDVLYGLPAINLPVAPVQGVPTATPEIALARRTDQKGVAKVAVFAYHRESGRPVWQSGVDTIASRAQNSWLFGIGPTQRGTIYDKAQFAGGEFRFPLLSRKKKEDLRTVRVTRETQFNDPNILAMRPGDELAKFGESLKSPALPMAAQTNLSFTTPSVQERLNSSIWVQPVAPISVATAPTAGMISSPPSMPSPAIPHQPASEPIPAAKLLGPLVR
ncbi:MAG: hypothetical protein IT427_17850 [Pirellulales bacterium]|nr:hypothetical protein [Pirellulales bacterium]